MQLLPTTAKLMNDEDVGNKNIADNCSGPLLDPTTNLALGQKYVRHLTSQPLIGDNLMLLLAAYNEGPGKLERGLRDDNGSRVKSRGISSRRAYEKEDPLYFLESLPLRQTHDYIQQVLIHYWGYRARLDEPQTSLTELARGEWPRYAQPKLPSAPPKGQRDALLPQGSLSLASN
jgi:soluble lytic murein transglycosylase-like protein